MSMGGVVMQAFCSQGQIETGVAGENVMASVVSFSVHVQNLSS
jgi:hypothetical protein